MAKKKSENAAYVRVTGQPVCEDGEHFVKGQVFETTPERAAALGDLVEAVEAPAPAPAAE